MSEQAVTFTIDGKAVTVPKGTTVFNAAKQLGIEIPIFCYHDRMPPFGACRVCLVEVEKMPKLQASCTLEAMEGMVVKTQSQIAQEGRSEILEFLLINHPLDCPICDRAGECPLQEHVYSHGPGESRFYEDKRKFKKALPLGPVLMLDRERCIVCARCTRFGDRIAGDHALELIDRGFKSQVGTPDGAPAESKFIGNTIMICPVGALTSQVYRFRARPWDNQSTPSTCTLCPVGCSMALDSRDGEVMRVRSSENPEVNAIWLCDKGWFGYEFSSDKDRLQTPLIRRNGILEPAGWDEALSLVAKKMKEFQASGKIAGFGGNPLTTEENYQFQKLFRDILGIHNLDHRIGSMALNLEEEGLSPGMEIAIGEIEQLNYVVLAGLDLTEEFPVIWLRVKEAINKGAKVIFLGHYAPEMANQLFKTVVHSPGKELEIVKEQLFGISDLGAKGAILVGRQYLDNPGRQSILSELVQLRRSTPGLSLNIMEGQGNSMGARVAGMRPDLKPLGEKPNQKGLSALEVLQETVKNGWDLLYVAGSNPANKFPSKLWEEAKNNLNFLVVQDLFLTETALQADVVLPTLCYIEKGGTFVNIEGRLQKLLPGIETSEEILSDGEIFVSLAERLNASLEIDDAFQNFLKMAKIKFDVSNGLASTVNKASSLQKNEEDLFATFAPELFDHGVRMNHSEHLVKLAKEPKIRIHPKEGERRGLRENDRVSLSANGVSIAANIRLDKRVAEQTAVLPLGFPEVPVQNLGVDLRNGLVISIKKEVS